MKKLGFKLSALACYDMPWNTKPTNPMLIKYTAHNLCCDIWQREDSSKLDKGRSQQLENFHLQQNNRNSSIQYSSTMAQLPQYRQPCGSCNLWYFSITTIGLEILEARPEMADTESRDLAYQRFVITYTAVSRS
ncbi:hypothetical protein NPIL_272001 [Nephila pilipes]|uniref:Uncharacterized protein n=1 Tax=Nephila pilipes TaxID=299642 RepID=A0A8X6P577_NEPPI|nr:hypothetical protein NPIL_272001 [Nephila pilipes]